MRASAATGLAPLAADALPVSDLVDGQETNARVVEFETSEIRASIRVDGEYHGVSRLLHKSTGRQVIDGRYSALNLYRLFSVNSAMGQPRRMERTSRQGRDWVTITWPATEAHQGVITARYELAGPHAIDLWLTVESEGNYRGYEIFAPSYFDKALVPHAYLKPSRGTTGPPELVVPTVNDVFRGTVVVFPRDAHAARRCVDGRWERREFSSSVVQMCPVRHYGHCCAIMKDPEGSLAAVLMADPSECYAISARYHADNDADRLTTYSAFDLSLFGDDVTPGYRRTVKVRLALVETDAAMTRPLDLYQEFLRQRIGRSSARRDSPRKDEP